MVETVTEQRYQRYNTLKMLDLKAQNNYVLSAESCFRE